MCHVSQIVVLRPHTCSEHMTWIRHMSFTEAADQWCQCVLFTDKASVCCVHPPAKEEGMERQCCICLGDHTNNSELAMFPCRHFVCVSCYRQLLKSSLCHHCPMCRGPLTGAMPAGKLYNRMPVTLVTRHTLAMTSLAWRHSEVPHRLSLSCLRTPPCIVSWQHSWQNLKHSMWVATKLMMHSVSFFSLALVIVWV